MWRTYKNRPEFSDAFDYLETTLEDYNELKLGWAGSTAGAVFWLKNKAGWTDETTQKNEVHIVEVKPEVVDGTPPLENKE